MTATKPYLTAVPRTAEGADGALQWARYLGETFGTSGALTALRYYERMGWITTDVVDAMSAHLCGLSLDETHHKKYEEPASLDPPLDSLSGTPFGAHAKSLAYVARIADDDLEEHLLLGRLAERRVDRELDDRDATIAVE